MRTAITKFVRFHTDWLSFAFKRSWSVLDWVATAVGLGIGWWVHVHPDASESVKSLVWQAPLYAAGLVVLVRLLLAPYWLHRCAEAERDVALKAVEDEKNEVNYDVEDKRATLKLRLNEKTKALESEINCRRMDIENKDVEIRKLRQQISGESQKPPVVSAAMREKRDFVATRAREARSLIGEWSGPWGNPTMTGPSQDAWRGRATQWIENTYSALFKLAPPAAERFADSSGLWDGVDASRYAYVPSEFRMLERHLQNLNAILDQSDKYFA